MKFTTISLALITAVWFWGCTEHPSAFHADSSAYISVNPEDGDTAVSVNTSISLSFLTKVDRVIVERNFHLINEAEFADTICPVNGMLNHGGMEMAMADSSIMDHFNEYHNTHGHIEWDGSDTRCQYVPDSSLHPDAMYMIHLGGEMVRMMEDRMGSGGIMVGENHGLMAPTLSYHFRTGNQ